MNLNVEHKAWSNLEMQITHTGNGESTKKLLSGAVQLVICLPCLVGIFLFLYFQFPSSCWLCGESQEIIWLGVYCCHFSLESREHVEAQRKECTLFVGLGKRWQVCQQARQLPHSIDLISCRYSEENSMRPWEVLKAFTQPKAYASSLS